MGKKDLFKGDTGEYVSLSKVEAFLKLSPFVEMPMVYGRTGAKTVIALICPKKFQLQKIAKDKGIEGSFDELCQNPDVVSEVTKIMLAGLQAEWITRLRDAFGHRNLRHPNRGA